MSFVYVPRKKSKLSLKGKRKRLKAAAAAAKQLKLKHLDTVQQTCPLPSILNPPVTKSTIVHIDAEEYGSEGSEEDLPPTQDDDDDDDAAREDLFSNIPPSPPPPLFSKNCCYICSDPLPYELMDAQVHLEHCRRFAELTSKPPKKTRTSKKTTTSINVAPDVYVPTSVSHDIEHELWRCPICNVKGQTQSTEQRLRHVKRCGQKYGIRPHELTNPALQCNDNNAATSTSQKVQVFVPSLPLSLISPQPPLSISSIPEIDGTKNSLKRPRNTMNNFVTKNAFGMLMNTAKRQHLMTKENDKFAAHQKKVKIQRAAWKATKSKKKSSWRRRTTNTSNENAIPTCKKIPTKPRPLIVDGFQYSNSQLSRFYFLSHFHSDHYIGLTKHFNAGLIFCSLKTKRLVHLRLKVPENCVIGLPLNVPISLAQYDPSLTLESVTLLHANHTPDGVTFLFKLKNGQIHWHTGDFRYLPEMIDNNEILNNCAKYKLTTNGQLGKYSTPLSLHTLYLDTTYCNPKYDLPKQTVAVRSVIKYIEKIRSTTSSSSGGSTSTVYLFGTYTIGKEKVFCGVCKHFNEKIVVMDSQKKKILQIAMDDYDTVVEKNPTSSSSLFVTSMGDLSYEKVLDVVIRINKVRGSGRVTKVYAFKPTGWAHQGSSSSSSKKQQVLGFKSSSSSSSSVLPVLKLQERRRKVCDIDVTIVSVPYSEHSSFPELQECVQRLGAKRVLPTVGAFSQRDAMVQMLKKKK